MNNSVYVIGMGGGDIKYMTGIALSKMKLADTLLGAGRHLDIQQNEGKNKIYLEHGIKKLLIYIKQNYKKEQLAVLVSGDTGFHSLLRYLKKNTKGIEFEIFTSPSSISILFSKLGMMWDDSKLLSAHGNELDIVKAVKENKKVALLTDGETTPKTIAKKLYESGVDNKIIVVGERLTYSDEKVTKLFVEEALNYDSDKLCVVVIYDESIYI